jgi:hypothetical protein
MRGTAEDDDDDDVDEIPAPYFFTLFTISII